MNLFLKILALLPSVLQAVEAIGQAAHLPGTTKKELALTSLKVATAGADAISPDHAAQFDEISGHVGNAIDAAVGIANAVGAFTKPAPAPAPVVEMAPATNTVPLAAAGVSNDPV